MKRSVQSLILGLLLSVSFSLLAIVLPQAVASADPIVPPRQRTVEVEYTAYTWWLATWGTNEVVCSLIVDHDGAPTHPEVRQECGEETYQQWSKTSSCAQSSQEPSACKGLYLHLEEVSKARRTDVVDLPPPTIFLSLDGCDPGPSHDLCTSQPRLALSGYEPLLNETIIGIRGMYAGVPFYCPSNRCTIKLNATPAGGTDLTFWAESSVGDSSAHYTALVRALPLASGPDLAQGGYVDVLSSQWLGPEPASCSAVWGALPPPGGPPVWLTTPTTPDEMMTNEPYTLLAGLLISHGLAAADGCPDQGLLGTGAASPCGLDAARSYVMRWQNQFDRQIISAGQSKGVPAQLIKNVIAIESQFWPSRYQEGEEVGLGHLTEDGADSILMWSTDFFNGFCPQVLQRGVCAKGYVHLLPGEQAMLRGALLARASAYCQDCPVGIDLSKADSSIEIFAEALKANCRQVGKMVENTTGEPAGRVMEYVDLWRLTVSNYNAGPGCLSMALKLAWSRTRKLTWETVSSLLSPACQPTKDYVERVSQSLPASSYPAQ